MQYKVVLAVISHVFVCMVLIVYMFLHCIMYVYTCVSQHVRVLFCIIYLTVVNEILYAKHFMLHFLHSQISRSTVYTRFEHNLFCIPVSIVFVYSCIYYLWYNKECVNRTDNKDLYFVLKYLALLFIWK